MFSLDEFGHLNKQTADGGAWGQCRLTEMGYFLLNNEVQVHCSEILGCADGMDFVQALLEFLEQINCIYEVGYSVTGETVYLISSCNAKNIERMNNSDILYLHEKIIATAYLGDKQILGWQNIDPQTIMWALYDEPEEE